MNAVDRPAPRLASTETHAALGNQWRGLRRAATFVAILTTPAFFVWLHSRDHISVGWSLVISLVAAIAVRGGVDLVFRRFIPQPILFGTDDARLAEDDVLNRRRLWFWRQKYRLAAGIVLIFLAAWFVELIFGHHSTPWTIAWHTTRAVGNFFKDPTYLTLFVQLPVFFLVNFLIFMGPMMLMGISQIRGYEPGDATWGVKLDHVRGQAEAKEEVRRVVDLWQSGETFEAAGGKRERGLLFLGAPGTGKTMLAKAIATGFNSPIVTIPGSGFAQTFIGIDVLIVRYLARKAKKLAAKWGGQCIVFIDEIDAVGMRRQSLQGQSMTPRLSEQTFYGQFGALNASGDLVVENAAWREHLFAQRAEEPRSPYPAWMQRIGNLVNQFPGGMFGGMGAGQLALNQLLITMDGIDNPPFFRRVFTNRINTLLDASYVVPRRLGRVPLRVPHARPTGNQIYFIGATNVPIQNLDPALTRPGRLGRHVWFRTPTKDDRKDIFDLYLDRVAHEPDLDHPQRRDEIARITNGYSPAMIEQICSMALTNAHHEGRHAFTWQHLVDAMTTVESGTAVGVRYVESETRAVAIHEAGHAATAHVYRPGLESSRLSIRMRGGSLGHHQAFEKEERFSQWQSEAMGDLVHSLGAMAAERVFYGENTSGVGGDLGYATQRAAMMVGAAGMGPQRIDLAHARMDDESEAEARERIAKRFERIGLTLMNRTRGSVDFHEDPVASVLHDPHKRASAAQMLGEAYVTADNFIRYNRDAVEKIAEAVIEKQELYGDELVRLLDSVKLQEPTVDLTREEAWPTL
ncbi:MAG TPA: AAA family ATPase [Gaiellaceae bacterium]|nr:AAA family ATPase [Gaiellaceae bacterium]